jgi:hypothetical protein
VELQGVIGTTLEYFQELENATHLLNHPGESLVLQTDFLYMVERVDICIEFLKSHVRPIYSRFPPLLSNIPSGIAKLQRSRSIPVTIPAVHDPSHDTHQNVLRRVAPSADARYLTTTIRTGLSRDASESTFL